MGLRKKRFRSPKVTTVIGKGTAVDGNVRFSGGLHVDGVIKGNVISEPEDEWATLTLSEDGKIEGNVEQVTSVGGVEIPIGSFTYIDYTWIGENSLLLASASSQENESNPDFSIASDVMWLSEVMGNTGILPESEVMPSRFELHANYPNPFNPNTKISFYLPATEYISMLIYDLNGQLVRQLFSGQLQAGTHQFTWKGMNDAGELVSSGTYFYKLEGPNFNAVRKMTFLK